MASVIDIIDAYKHVCYPIPSSSQVSPRFTQVSTLLCAAFPQPETVGPGSSEAVMIVSFPLLVIEFNIEV